MNISRDPYSYAAGSPTMFVDPTGLLIVGFCYDAGASAVTGAGVGGCIVNDGDSISVVGTKVATLGTVGATLSNGYFFSNAEDASELRGKSHCVTVGFGADGLYGGVTVCQGYNSDGTRSDIWSVYLGVGIATPGGDISFGTGETGVTEIFCYGDPVESAREITGDLYEASPGKRIWDWVWK